MFGRDLFHYGLSAVVFCFSVLSPIILMALWGGGGVSAIDLTFNLDAWEKTALTVCLVLLSYALGHILLSIGFVYRAFWKRMFSWLKHVQNLVRAEEKVKALFIQGASAMSNVSPYPHDFHIIGEMSVFHRLPDVHATFIERYNTLAFFRLGLASSMISGGLVCISLLKIASIFYAISMAVLWLSMGVILLRQHFITLTGFLNRIAAAYTFSENGRK